MWCRGKAGEYAIFIIPVDKELDLKKAAKAAGEKSVQMISVKDIFKITGYIRGGCSPIGMKKTYKTFLDASAKKHAAIFFSGGRIGSEIETSPEDLLKVTGGIYADLRME